MKARHDGREIDPEVALLLGEAAGQIATERPPSGITNHPFQADMQTYYDRPMLKEPVWEWSVPSYFYASGAAGTSLALAAMAQILDSSCGNLVTRCRQIGLAGTSVGAALLIYDLGRPRRFLNMLRVFRPTSPMNIGSWLLAATSSLAGAAVLTPSSGAKSFRDAAAIGAGIFGIPLSGYTGVLLGNTAIPVWNEASGTLPVLFMASGMAAAGALLHLMQLSRHEEMIVRRFAIAGQAAELGGMIALERKVSRVEAVGRPLKEGFSGFLWKSARILGMASLAMSLLSGKSRRLRIAAGICGTAAALSLRFSVLQAGRNSARDPDAAFQQQRRTELPGRSSGSIPPELVRVS